MTVEARCQQIRRFCYTRRACKIHGVKVAEGALRRCARSQECEIGPSVSVTGDGVGRCGGERIVSVRTY